MLDSDTTIDASNSFLDADVEIKDGADGPTTVTLEDGGVLHRGVVVSGSSQLIMKGGDIDFFVTVEDEAKLTIIGGGIGCRVEDCMWIDYDSLIWAAGSADIHILGGDIYDSLFLQDTAAVHFYGTDLLTEETRGGNLYVSGLFANNAPFRLYVSGGGLTGRTVVLHTMPEPSTLALGAVVLAAVGWRRRA